MKKMGLFLALVTSVSLATIVYPLEESRQSSLLEMPGKPQLKSYDLSFLLPVNVDPHSVSVTISGDTTVVSGIEKPVGDPFVVNGEEYWAGVENVVDGKDMAVYGVDAFYPASGVSSYSLGKMRAFNLLSVTICSESYNPVTKELRTVSNPVVEIDYTLIEEQRSAAPAPKSFHDKVAGTVVNYEQFASEYGTPQRAKGTYAIITSAALKSSLSSLDEFVRVKHGKGYNVEVYTEDTWGGGDGETAAIRIREWLQQNYEAKNIEYVLFIGNPSEGATPMKFCYPDFGGRYKCYVDFYYGDLSGDWDITKDGKYGMWKLGSSGDNQPGGCDQYAEVYVGRIPYYGSVNETEAILQKLIKYETQPPNEVAWRNNVYLPLNAFEAMDGSQLGRALCDKVFTPAGNSVTKLYDSQCSIDGVIQKWNSGKYGIVTWQGHGLADYTEKVMYSHRAPELNDAYPAHVYQISCHNGKPQQSNNLGYAILKNAAISTVSASVQVLYSVSMKELGTSSTTRHWAYMYDKGLVLDSLSSGEAQAQAKATLKITFDSDWLNAFEMNLYGCPEIGLYSYGAIPTSVEKGGVSEASNSIAIDVDKKVLHFTDTFQGDITLYSIDGKKLLSRTIEQGSAVNMVDLAPGVYLLEIQGDSGFINRQRITLN